MIAVVLKIEMCLVKIFNIFTSILAKDQNLLLLRFIRQPFNLSTAEKSQNLNGENFGSNLAVSDW